MVNGYLSFFSVFSHNNKCNQKLKNDSSFSSVYDCLILLKTMFLKLKEFIAFFINEKKYCLNNSDLATDYLLYLFGCECL